MRLSGLAVVVFIVAGFQQAACGAIFTDNFDLYSAHKNDYLYSVTNAHLNNEGGGLSDVWYWAPNSASVEGSIVYHYVLPRSITTASLFAQTGTALHFDAGAKVYLDISRDGTSWTNLFSTTGPAHSGTDYTVVFDVSSTLSGSTEAWVRGRVFEDFSWGSIHMSQFLRTANGIKAPYVYQFQAEYADPVPEPNPVPEPSSLVVMGGLFATVSIAAWWRRRSRKAA